MPSPPAADHGPMDISGSVSISLQAKTLDAVRGTLASAQAAPATPQAQQDVILQLSTAAQQMLKQPPMPVEVSSPPE
jgi:hypothetical protein